MFRGKALAGLPVFQNTSNVAEAPPWPHDFATLYQEHHSLVRSVLFQIAGAGALDDLVQEAFIRIWKGMGSFKKEAKLSSWIYRICVNTALDHLRTVRRRPEDPLNENAEPEKIEPGPESSLMKRDLIARGLMNLSEDHRTVLVLAFIHDLPLSEVADVLSISEGTVKSRLHYAKAQFRQYLQDLGVTL